MEIRVEIETFDKDLDFDLFGTKTLSKGMQKTIAEGVSVAYEYTEYRKAVGFADIIHVIVTIGRDVPIGVAAGLIATWLYDKLKGRKVEKLKIERTEIEVDKGEIKRVIMEKIEKD